MIDLRQHCFHVFSGERRGLRRTQLRGSAMFGKGSLWLGLIDLMLPVLLVHWGSLDSCSSSGVVQIIQEHTYECMYVH